MKRLSRAQSQARTRDKLLETAKASFLRDGFALVSIDQIAETAGFSKGAVYSNFKGKDELCLAVIELIRAERIAALAAAMRAASTLDQRLAALQRWAKRNVGDRAWTALEAEFGVYASRTPALARVFVKQNRLLRARVAAVVAAFAEESDQRLPLPAEEVALALVSIAVGLGLQRAVDPSIPVSILSTMLRLFVGAGAPG